MSAAAEQQSSWDSLWESKQALARIEHLERQVRELSTPDAERAKRVEETLVQVLEWLDGLVESTESERLGIFCDRLAAMIRETLYGGNEDAPR